MGSPAGRVGGVCGRFSSQTSAEELAAYFEAENTVAEDPGPRFNVAPTQDVLAVVGGEGGRRLGTLRWGLVPSWAGDPSIGSRLINARAETVRTKPAFRSAFERRRCLIPADGFYEWQARPGQQRKQPWYVRRRDGAPLAFAGLWEVWRDAEGGRLATCVIVTTGANATVAPLHDRMPVVLEAGRWDTWLDRANVDAEALAGLLVPAADDLLVAVPVSTAVNDVRNDGPELVEPVTLEDGPAAGRS